MAYKNQDIYIQIESRDNEVTGSNKLIEVSYPDNTKEIFEVDCGLFQEQKYEEKNFFYDRKMINADFVLITHNHLDHVGKLPYIVSKGYRQKIYTTSITKFLMNTGLYNSASIYDKDSISSGEPPYYTEKDVSNTLDLVESHDFNYSFNASKHIKVTFFENAHMLGAAYILVQISYPGCKSKNLFFTGDYKEKNELFQVKPFPKWLKKLNIDIMVCESTYGISEKIEEDHFINDIVGALIQNKIVFIASIAQERLEQILYKLTLAQYNNILPENCTINIDSTLGIAYLKDYKRILGSLFLPNNLKFWNKSNRNILLSDSSPKIIIASSGMGDRGISPLYIRRFLNRTDAIIYFTSYLAEGTPGYHLVNSQDVTNVYTTNEFSSHARFNDFLNIFSDLKISSIFVNHGTHSNKIDFCNKISEKLNLRFVKILSDKVIYIIKGDNIFEKENTLINLYSKPLNKNKFTPNKKTKNKNYKNHKNKKRFAC